MAVELVGADTRLFDRFHRGQVFEKPTRVRPEARHRAEHRRCPRRRRGGGIDGGGGNDLRLAVAGGDAPRSTVETNEREDETGLIVEDEPRMAVLTARDGATVQGLDAGADDYRTKPFSFDELWARIPAACVSTRSRGDGVDRR